MMGELSRLPRRDALRWDCPGSSWQLGQRWEAGRGRIGRQGGLCAAGRAGTARVGAGGSQHTAEGSFLPTGEEKQIRFSAFQRKGGQLFFFDVANVS